MLECIEGALVRTEREPKSEAIRPAARGESVARHSAVKQSLVSMGSGSWGLRTSLLVGGGIVMMGLGRDVLRR